MNIKREIISILAAVLLMCFLLLTAGWLLLPESYVNCLKWGAYRSEEKNTIDVFYVGSSMAFCDIAPAMVYEESGITGYLVSGSELTIPISYYFICEASKTQSPKAVFLELGGMFFSRHESFSADNIAFMPFGKNHFEAAFKAANPEDTLKLLFPVLSYHTLWSSCTGEELRGRLFPEPDLKAGFVPLDHINDDPEITFREYGYAYYDYSFKYLEKTARFCQERGIQLYLFFTPALARTPDSMRERLEKDIETLEIAGYINFNAEENWNALGLDPLADFADSIHLNTSGAKKVSADVAGRLLSWGFVPTEGEDEELWQMRIDALK